MKCAYVYKCQKFTKFIQKVHMHLLYMHIFFEIFSCRYASIWMIWCVMSLFFWKKISHKKVCILRLVHGKIWVHIHASIQEICTIEGTYWTYLVSLLLPSSPIHVFRFKLIQAINILDRSKGFALLSLGQKGQCQYGVSCRFYCH